MTVAQLTLRPPQLVHPNTYAPPDRVVYKTYANTKISMQNYSQPRNTSRKTQHQQEPDEKQHS